MNRLTIPSILAATLLVAVIFALMPVEKASTVHTTILAGQRAMNTITDISIAANDRVILLDNAGIGGKADVELTWSFSDLDCKVQTTTDQNLPIDTFTTAPNDAAFADVAHADVTGVEAVAIFALTNPCDMTHALGDFVTVTVVKVP